MFKKLFKFKVTKKEKRRIELRALIITLAVLVGILLATWLVIWQGGQDKSRIAEMRQQAAQVQPDKTVPPNTSKIGGPFVMTNQDGKIVTDADFKGKNTLIYFGYTYCPDMCPTGLQSMSRAMDQLGPDADKVQPLFVTIDPDRDTPAKLKEYDAEFHPKIIGLTGTADQVATIAKEYQVYYARGEKVDEHDYMMDHSSLIYLMDPDGALIATFPEDADPQTIVKALKTAWNTSAPAPK